VQVFSDGERSGLLSDVMNLVRARLLSHQTALDLTTYLQRCDQSGIGGSAAIDVQSGKSPDIFKHTTRDHVFVSR